MSTTSRGVLLLIAASAAVLLADPVTHASASARTSSLAATVDVRLANSDNAPQITVRARSVAGAKCVLAANASKQLVQFPAITVTRRGVASWRWTVPAGAPSGTWRFSVRCSKGRATGRGSAQVLVVAPEGRSGGLLIPGSFAPVSGSALGSVGQGQTAGLGGAGNPFSASQCTSLAWERRADLFNDVVARGIPEGGLESRYGVKATLVNEYGPWTWDGEKWFINAQKVGYPTGQHPVAGAIVSWGGNANAPWGHVGYVVQAYSDTDILLEERNYDLRGSTRTIRTNPQTKGRLLGYVYGGPAGNGPGTPPSAASGGELPGTGGSNTGPATPPATTGGIANATSSEFFIKTKNVGSGQVEVHTATSASGFQQADLHAVSGFSPADADNGWFQMVGKDLFFIKTKNPGSGHVEVHSATAASGYREAGQHSVTWFSPSDADNGWFQMVGSDLYFIKTKNTGSGKVEVHSATAASGYQNGIHAATWFGTGDADNGWFQMVGADLYFTKTKNVGSGKVEVHSATVASGYQQAGLHATTWFSPGDANNGWFSYGPK